MLQILINELKQNPLPDSIIKFTCKLCKIDFVSESNLADHITFWHISSYRQLKNCCEHCYTICELLDRYQANTGIY